MGPNCLMSEQDKNRQRMKAAFKAHFIEVIRGQRPPGPDVGHKPAPPPPKYKTNNGGVKLNAKGSATWDFRKARNVKGADDRFNPLDALDAALALAEDGPLAGEGGRDPYDTGD